MPFNIKPPKDDDEYFERMCHAVFQAGLNWKMIENKWPNFKKAFANFSIEKVAKFYDRDVESLMKDTGIVRNEKKIRSTIHNAQEFKRIQEEFKSFPRYMGSFRGAEDGLSHDMQERFRHLGPSSARMYMWMIGMKPVEEVFLSEGDYGFIVKVRLLKGKAPAKVVNYIRQRVASKIGTVNGYYRYVK